MNKIKTWKLFLEKYNTNDVFNMLYDEDFMKEYIETDHDVNLINDEQQSLLSASLRDDEMKTAEMLINAGADIDHKDGFANVLFYAVDYMNLNIVKLLIEKGVIVTNEPTNYGDETELENAVMRADNKNDWEIVNLLLKHGGEFMMNTQDTLKHFDNKFEEISYSNTKNEFKNRVKSNIKEFNKIFGEDEIKKYFISKEVKKFKI